MKLMRNKSAPSSRKTKIFLWIIPAIICTSALTWTLSSCANSSSRPSSLDSQIDTGDGSKFGDKFSLTDIAKQSLQNKDSYNSLLRWKIGEALQSWFKNSKSSSYRDDYNKIVKDVDKDWKDKVTSAKNNYRTWWQSSLRQDLDNDGAKDVNAWKQSEINKKVIDKFISDVFGVDYFGYRPSSSNTKIDKRTILPSDLNNQSNWSHIGFFADNSDLDATNGSNKDVADTYASFQTEVFDQWVKETLPILTSSVLYKNSQPKSGLNEIFSSSVYSTASGISLTPSYQFQAFPDASEGAGGLTSNANELFQTFCNALSNHASSYYNDQTGAVNFPAKWTEDNATGILVNTTSMYDNLFLPYAAGTSCLLLNAFGGLNANENIYHETWNDISKSPKNLLSRFIVLTASFGNHDWLGFTDPNYFQKILADPIKNPNYSFYHDLANTGELGNSIVDMFICDDLSVSGANGEQKTLPLVLLRDGPQNGAGVHILTIDGYNHFVKKGQNGKNIFNVSDLENFLKFRGLQKISGSGGYKTPELNGNNVDFNLSKSVKDYFNSSDDIKLNLIADFLQKQTDKKTKDTTSPFYKAVNDKAVGNLKKLVGVFNEVNFNGLRTEWEKYQYSDKLVKERKNIRSKILANAKTFIDNIKDNKKEANGIAGRLPFQISAADGSVNALEKFYQYKTPNTKDGTDTGPTTWWTQTGDLTNYFKETQNIESETPNLTEITKKSSAYIDSLKLSKATNIDYSEYVQNIYTNNDAINSTINAILTASSTDNVVSDNYKLSVLTEFAKSFKVLSYSGDKLGLKSVAGEDPKTKALTSAVVNSYYLKNVFQSELADRSAITTGIPTEFTKDGFEKYLSAKFQNRYKDSTSFKVNYLLFLNTLDYLLSPSLDSSGKQTGEINLTSYLQQSVSFGTSAYVAWLSGTPMKASGSGTAQPSAGYSKEDITKLFTSPSSLNVDYAFGADENYLNLDKKDKTHLAPNPYLLNSIFRSAPIKDNGQKDDKENRNDYFGFCGLVTDSSNASLPPKVSSTIFNALNFRQSSGGQLYAYGDGKTNSKHTHTKIIEYILGLQNISQLQSFAEKLQKAGADVMNVLRPEKSDISLDDLKHLLLNDLEHKKDTYFKYSSGFVAQDQFIEDSSKGELDLVSDPTYTPIQDDSKDKLGYFAYLQPVNYYDVSGLDGKSGVTTAFISDTKHRLNLSLEAFLGIAADYAMNNSDAQQVALDRIISPKTGDNRPQVYDQRLMKLLTSQWVRTVPKDRKVI